MLRCTPLNHAAAMLKVSGQCDPDPQRYLTHRNTHTQTDIETDRQRLLAFIESYYFIFLRYIHFVLHYFKQAALGNLVANKVHGVYLYHTVPDVLNV